MWVALGKITVPTAGVPRRLIDALSPGQLVQLAAEAGPGPIHGIMLQAWHANTGKVFVGTAGMDKTSGANVGALIAVPTVNAIPAFSMALTLVANALALSDFYLDVDTGGEGVVVSVLVT